MPLFRKFAAIAASASASDLTTGTMAAARMPAFGSGDVSFAAGGGAGTIPAGDITNAKMANMADQTVKGNVSGGSAAPADLTMAQLSTAQISATNPMFGFDMPLNLRINASVASNILTVAVKGINGSDPSATNPVLAFVRDVTLANGDPVPLLITAALSINTNATGATLGSRNNTPFRFWVVLFNNGGTPVLGLINCSRSAVSAGNQPSIFPLNEGTLVSTTAMSGSATSVGTFYTPTGTTLTSKAFRIIGYIEYTTTLTTAGTYTAAPDIVQLFGPGIKKPGDTIQIVWAQGNTTGSSTSSTLGASVVTASITPTSASSIIEVTADALGQVGTAADGLQVVIGRGSSAQTVGLNDYWSVNTSGQYLKAMHEQGLDMPATTSAQAYTTYFASSDNVHTVNYPTTAAGNPIWMMKLIEIQG